MVILETPRLFIRVFVEADAPLAFAYSQETCTFEQLPDEVFESIGEAEERLKKLISNYESHSLPLVYAVVLKDSGLLIGHVSLSDIENGRVEIGYAIATAYQGKGYATELIRPFSEWAKATLGIDKVYGIVKATNTASWRCLEKAGFTFVCVENHKLFRGFFPVRIYSF